MGLSEYFARGTHPFELTTFERRDALIEGPTETPVFEQRDVSFPVDWSQNATNIVAQKYFAGQADTENREWSVKQLIGRVVEKIGSEGLKNGYFDNVHQQMVFEHELAHILVHQMAAFNSPVWFNIGVKGVSQQASACFILHIEDSLDDITRWYAEEAKIFQNGSGAGLNLSALRSSDEPLSRGGKSSGPVTFMRAADASAGTITSGGRCLAPDQRVYTATGPVPVKDLAESGEDFVVFSYDPPAGRYAAKTARAWKQPFTKMLVELCTDKGSFRLSEDHPVRLSTGEFVKAGELKAGQSLFAGTISHTHDGYLRIGLKDGMKTKARLHRLVAEDLLPEDIDGMSVHHCDGNPFNNSPGNLEVMTQSDHASLHGKQEAQAGNHLFQNRTFAKSGSDNPMHADGDFWKDEEKVSAYKGRQSAILLADPGRAVDMQQAASQQKMLNTAFAVLNAGHKIDTFEDYVAGRKQTMGRIPSITKLRSTIDERFGSYEAFVAEVSANNHRVTEVKVLGESAVYDVEVDCPTPDDKSPSSGHNFLIWDSEDIVGSGIVVSNTRRAAKMIVLDVDHPDIEDFIWCKAEEEKKARALAAAGFDMSLNTPEGERNWASLQYQNANNSVRLSDQFLKAVEKDEDFHLIARSTGEPVKTVKARALLAQIADAAWESADPGVQYDTTINSWHTCPNHSKITASNPCCFTGDTLVDTAEGKIRFDELERRCSAGEKLPYVFAWDIEARLPVLRRINRAWVAGHGAKLIEVTTDKGITVRCTPEHRFLTHAGEYVEAQHLAPGTRLRKIGRHINKQRSDRRYLNHRVTEQSGNGTVNQARFMWEQVFGPIPEGMDVHHVNGDPSDDRLENFALRGRLEHRSEHSSGSGNPRFIEVDDQLLVQIFEEIEATPVKGRMMEVSPGRWNNYIRRNNLVGEVPMAQSPTTGGRIHGGSWEEFAQFIEQSRSLVNDRVAEVIWLDQTATVYDLEVEGTHNFTVTDQSSVHSLVVHNSEYMHVDNSSCNLASLNLMKFRREDGTFNVESFRHAAQVMFTAQEILISFADYPTEEIGDNTRAMRQIGLGYANLGAYLMASGLPYDSDEGRQVAGSITALMHCEAYAQSARIAERMGAYDQFRANEDAQLRVIRRHRTAANKLVAWEGDQDLTRAAKRAAREMVELADKNGVRNSQVTVSAPTGCLTPDAMVLTDQGLARLGELGRLDGDQWQDADFQVQTDEGPKQATKFYVNGQAQVARVVSARGYELAGTPQHQVKKVAKDGSLEWARLSDLSEGDMIPIRRGGMLGRPRQVALPPLSEPYFAGLQDVFAPHEMTADLAELVGYFMGDGSLHSRGLRLQVAGTDRDVIERLAELAQGLFGLKVGLTTYDNHYQVEIHSTQLAGWWKACGFSKSKPSATHVGKGWVPHIPAAVRASNDPEIYGAFLRGLFEADGGAYENHTVSFSSAKKCFADEVKSMLLAVGIPTNSKIDMPGNGHKGDGPVYVLRVLNRNAAQDYRAKVGFISSRKQGFLEMSDCDTSTQYSAFKHDLMPISKDLVDELCPGNGDLRRNLLQGLNRGRVSRFLVERMFEETGDPRLAHMMEYFYDTVKSCELAEESVTYDLSVPSNVTYVANGFLSHNTISFLMDCDTTGVEPDFSLVKYKKLVGGGAMTIVNQTVPPALARLGYDPQQSAEIVDFIREHNTVSDAPHMDPEHYQIFDTAIGQRSISYQGHLKMMAAIQPFMSGAISKTVNLPSDATREDIFNLYLDAWKMGLKAVAIYRDGTKTAQPLGDGSEDEDERTITSLLGDGLLRGQRRRVPDDGQAIKRRFEINSAASGKISGHIVVGLFEDGTPGEVFVNVAQAGSTLRGFIDTWSRLFSMALQYGAPLDELVAKQAFTQFEPAGFTNDKEISRAKSIPDYVVRWMAARFLDPDTHAMLGINRPEIVDHDEEKAELQRSEQEEVRPELKVAAATVAARPKTTSPQAGTSTCPKCGSMMVQTGKCMTCTGCGDTGGCG